MFCSNNFRFGFFDSDFVDDIGVALALLPGIEAVALIREDTEAEDGVETEAGVATGTEESSSSSSSDDEHESDDVLSSVNQTKCELNRTQSNHPSLKVDVKQTIHPSLRVAVNQSNLPSLKAAVNQTIHHSKLL